MSEKKLTKKDKFEMILNYVKGNEMLTEFINNEIELVVKKAHSKSKKDIQKEETDKELCKVIMGILMTSEKPLQVKEIQLLDSQLSLEEGISNQKVTFLLKKLIEQNLVEKTIEKKVSKYSAIK